jgi:hypothetical protein
MFDRIYEMSKRDNFAHQLKEHIQSTHNSIEQSRSHSSQGDPDEQMEAENYPLQVESQEDVPEGIANEGNACYASAAV